MVLSWGMQVAMYLHAWRSGWTASYGSESWLAVYGLSTGLWLR